MATRSPYESLPAFYDALMQTWPARAAKDAYQAMKLPGDVYAGRIDPLSTEGIDKSNALASLLTLGAGAVPKPRGALNMGIKAYHAGPHEFDKFDMSKIGTGEGTQMEGRGLYFGEQEDVARFYRESTPKEELARILRAAQPDLRPEQQRRLVEDIAEIVKSEGVAALDEYDPPRGFENAWNAAVPHVKNRGGLTGHMYEVDIAAEPDQFIDLNRTIGEQSAAIRDALHRVGRDPDVAVPRVADDMKPRDLRAILKSEDGVNKLRAHGVAGIRYLDGNSAMAGEGSSNYVVFDDSLVKILRKYGLAGLTAGLGATALGSGDAQAEGAPNMKSVEFEGKTYQFPQDATQEEIFQFLDSAAPAQQSAAPQEQGGGFMAAAQDALMTNPLTATAANLVLNRDKGTIADPVAQGGTFGFSDELAGIAGGVGSAVSGEGFGPGYSRSVEAARKRLEDYRAANPVLSTLGEVAGGVATGGGLAKGGLTLVGRAGGSLLGKRGLAAMAEGAGYGGLYGAGTGTDAQDRLEKAGTGALVGAVAGPVMEGVGSLVSKVLPGARKPNMAALSPEARAGVQAASEFDIPLTRGQATQDITQQAFEEAARHGSRGGGAERALNQFGGQQQAAVTAAQDDIARALGGIVPDTPYAAGDAVEQAVKAKTQATKEAGRQLYEEAKKAGVSIKADAIKAMPAAVRDALENTGAAVDENFMPVAKSALNELDKAADLISRQAQQGGKNVAMSLEGLDRVRRNIQSKIGSNPDDMRVVSAIKRNFDKWIEDAVDNSLFSGDPAGLDALKNARKLWSSYLSITRPKGGDDAGKLISKIATKDVDAVEVTNWLLGASKTGLSGRAVRAVKKIKADFGEEPVQSLRQAMWLKLTRNPEGKMQPGAQAISNAIAEFANGKGSALANELFSAKELQQMMRYSRALQATLPNPKATNPSKSGYRIAEFANSALDNIMTFIGFGMGGADAGIATKLGLPLLRDTRNAAAARSAIRTPIPPRASQLPGATAATGPLTSKIERRKPLEITVRPVTQAN